MLDSADFSCPDGHDDLAEKVRSIFRNHIYTPDFRTRFEDGGMPGHLDIPRMKQGKQGGFFWSCWVDCPANNFDFSDAVYAPSTYFLIKVYSVEIFMKGLLTGFSCRRDPITT